MLRRTLVIALAALSLAACSSDEVTVGPEEPGTVAEMDAAIRSAASALLSQESAPMTVVYFGFDEDKEVLRYDWVDYRPGGDILVITKHLSEDETRGYSRIDGVWSMASVTSEDSLVWTTDVPEITGEETQPGIGKLLAMVGQDSTTSDVFDTEASVVTQQGASDGSVLWTLVSPYRSGETMATQQWIISPNGVLQFYIFYTENAATEYGTIIYEFGAGHQTTDPVTAPELGMPLRLDEFEIPDALRDLENRES